MEGGNPIRNSETKGTFRERRDLSRAFQVMFLVFCISALMNDSDSDEEPNVLEENDNAIQEAAEDVNLGHVMVEVLERENDGSLDHLLLRMYDEVTYEGWNFRRGCCPTGRRDYLSPAAREWNRFLINATECREPLMRGHGTSVLVRWGFNLERGTCVSFIYSGLGGNQNNFESKRSCQESCEFLDSHLF